MQFKQPRFSCSDVYHLPFPSRSMDFVAFHFLFLWLNDPLTALHEILRVLKPGGTAAALAEPDYLARMDSPPGVVEAGRDANAGSGNHSRHSGSAFSPSRPGGSAQDLRRYSKYRVETLFASPVVLDRIARYGRKNPLLLPSLKKVITAGAPAPVSVLEEFQKRVKSPTRIFAIYGATEALPITLINAQEILAETRFASQKGAGICVGKAVLGIRVTIMPISDSPVSYWSPSLESPIHTVGEIVVSGPAVTAAYIGQADYNRLSKIVDPSGGFLHRTGDLAGWTNRDACGTAGANRTGLRRRRVFILPKPLKAFLTFIRRCTAPLWSGLNSTARSSRPYGSSLKRWPLVVRCRQSPPNCSPSAHSMS